MVATCSTWYLGQLLLHTSKCAKPMSPTQCNTTEVNRLLCSMAMTALRQFRASQSISADILSESDMKTTTAHKAFLANSKNKARLIDALTTELQGVGVFVKQDHADADRLIVSTTLTLAQTERKPVVVVGTDTDLLVIFIILISILFR